MLETDPLSGQNLGRTSAAVTKVFRFWNAGISMKQVLGVFLSLWLVLPLAARPQDRAAPPVVDDGFILEMPKPESLRIVEMQGKAIRFPDLPAPEVATADDVTIRSVKVLDQEGAFAPSFQDWRITRDGKKAVLLLDGRQISVFDQGRLYLVDLETGTMVRETAFQGSDATLMAISPSGKLAAYTTRSLQPSSRFALHLADLQAGQVLATWHVPHELGSLRDSSLQGVVFLDDERVVTLANPVLEWDLGKNKAVRTYHSDKDGPYAVSRDGRFLGTVSNNRVGVYDLISGKSLGSVACTSGWQMDIAFAPDCSLLAIGNGDRQQLVPLAGKDVPEPDTLHLPIWGGAKWWNQRYLLQSYNSIFDTQLGVVTWKLEYEPKMIGAPVSLDGVHFWYAIQEEGTVCFVRAAFPFDRLEETAASVDEESLRIFDRGEKVAIQTELPFPDPVLREIGAALEKQVQLNGGVPARKSDIGIRAFVREQEKVRIPLEGIEIRFSRTSDQFRHQQMREIEVTPTTSVLAIERDGKTIREYTEDNLIGKVIEVAAGETLQQAADRICSPDPKFYLQFLLQRRSSHIEQSQVGTSSLTKTGIR